MIKTLLKSKIVQIFLLTIIYYLAGKLALLLAVPPGFASPIFPAVGLGIAALLLFGNGVWPGIYLGAFLVNLDQSSSGTPIWLPLFIAVGNTTSLLVATFSIKKFIAFPKTFYLEKDIFLFLLLAGPLAGVISSSWGVQVLYLAQQVHSGNFALNWLYWFIGDATGGIIFSPLALIFSAQSRKYWLNSLTKVLVPLVIFFISIVIVLEYFTRSENDKLNAEFYQNAEFSFNLFDKDIKSFQSNLLTLRSFYESSEVVTRAEFKHFTTSLYANNPDVQAMIWIPVSSDLTNSFQIKFIEPETENADLKRIDFGANELNRKLIREALAAKDMVASGLLLINGQNANNSGVFLALAIARPTGVLVELIRFNKVLDHISNLIADSSYRIIIENAASSPPEILADTWRNNTKNHEERFFADLQWASTVKVGDHQWIFKVQQDSSIKEGNFFGTVISLFISLILTFLICALLLTVATRIIRTDQLVNQKTLHLQELNFQLERASKTKSEFLANMSHEIRTPLNVLLGMGELLEDSNLNEEQRHYLKVSQKAGQNLLSIINDILDISKIEANLVTLEKTEIDLSEVINEVFDMFKLKAEEKGLKLDANIDPRLHSIYLGDPTRIKQILSNLVSNAVKFTSHGFINIKVEPNQDPQRSGNILFTITDTGIGIPEDKISQLFQPFTQADSSITRKFGGTGLGLSICKRLCEMMNGTIDVVSKLNQGSSFSCTLDLPFVRSKESSPQNMLNLKISTFPSAGKLKILIVDDSSDNRALLKAYLKETQHLVLEAEDGAEAIQQYKNHRPDLIIMDMQMPVMDGYAATQEIRKLEKENNITAVPIWALTAYALTDDMQKSLQVGCNLHLIKPIRRNDFLKHINDLTQNKKI